MASVTQNKDENETTADELAEREDRAEKAPAPRRPEPTVARKDGAGFFTIYKKGQGYWTRMGTAVAAGLIIALTAHFVYRYLPPWLEPMFTPSADTATAVDRAAAATMARNVTLAVCAAILLGFGLLAWRLMNKPSNVDFLIATDGEMKKVNWTSRRELIGSTKVVIIFMFLIATILFLIDIIFGFFFQWINVLDAGPFG